MRDSFDSKIEWSGDIPFGWKVVRFKSLFSFRKGLNITKEDLVEMGVPVISYGQVHSKNNPGTSTVESLFRFVPKKYLDTNPTCLVKKNDFIFADTSEDYDGCGNCVYIDKDATIFAGYHTIIASSKDCSDKKYIAYQILTDGWRSQIRSNVWGIKVFSITQSILANSYAILPPRNEQQRIAAYLDRKCADIDDVMEKTRASIEEYKKLKQAAITEAVTKGVRGERPMKDSGIEWIGSYPEDWTLTKIKWLLNERNERSKEGSEEPLSMSQKYGLIPTKDMDTIPNMASTFVGAKIVHIGDLVFNKLKAHLGVFAVSQYDGLVSPDYAVYYKTARVDMRYLEYLFKTPQYILEFRKRSSGVGAGLTRLYTGDLFSMYTASPSIEEQKEIASYLDQKCSEIDSLIASKEKFITELESYKKSLIYEYVTGKKEVPEA